ncbi:MAG: sensor histidine kinase [Solirubrobacteraceae bacterium]|jgi:signal transduction histidine kinase
MNVRRSLLRPVFWLRHPQSTVHWRLTLLYGGLFLASGVMLLVITYLLVAHAAIAPNLSPRTVPLPMFRLLDSPQGQTISTLLRSNQRVADLHLLVLESGVALAVMAAVSAALGWTVAGRVLRPVRTITVATRQISDANLDRRLQLSGPRDELRELADTIDALLERLQRSFDAQRRFVANASHELRTPLTTMRTTLDVVVGKPGGASRELRALDADLREDLDQVDRLLDSFLILARAQSGGLPDPAAVRLEQIVEGALRTHREASAARGIEVRADLSPVAIMGSEMLLVRMVENVIENAVRHNQLAGFIAISCQRCGDSGHLIVENGGRAVDERSASQLAQPFRRLGAERTGSSNGFGLGLSIVAAVAAAHGGVLELHARAEGGLRVQITLPCLAQAPPREPSVTHA